MSHFLVLEYAVMDNTARCLNPGTPHIPSLKATECNHSSDTIFLNREVSDHAAPDHLRRPELGSRGSRV